MRTEKAGVGGSTPSLATIILKDLAELTSAHLQSALSPHSRKRARKPSAQLNDAEELRPMHSSSVRFQSALVRCVAENRS